VIELPFTGYPSEIQIFIGTIAIFGLGFAAYKAKAIDATGALAGGVISFVAFLAGGYSWLLVIVSFFAISSLLTRYRYDYKKQLGSAQEKGGVRSWPNTLANGLVAGFAALAEIATHQDIFIVGFMGAIAAAMSDTVATEIGLLSKSKPRMIVNLKKFVEPGTSGGVTLMGELACLTSALAITAIGDILGILSGSFRTLSAAALSVILGAIIATNFDSLLGGTVQGRNRCVVCGARTEALTHHDQPTVSTEGRRFLDNNVVNLLATLTGALISIALFLLFLAVIS
jgi:uncharacterized protein (TIGR00297 family)